jgi:DNA-binding transcriptional LysR family regulator
VINELKVNCFLCLAETLSFTETGKRMYMSQQAVSKHIAGLEADIGARLFARSRSSVALTEYGEQFYRCFKTAKADYERLRARVQSEGFAYASRLRVGYQNWLDLGAAPGAALAALRKDIPSLCLIGERHSPPALAKLLAENALDMIILHKRFLPPDGKLRKRLLIETPMQIVISAEHPLCASASDYRALLAAPMIIDAFENESEEATLSRARKEAAQYGYAPKEIIVAPNRDSVYTTAELGMGMFFGSSMAQITRDNTLRRFDTGIPEGLYCVWRADTPSSLPAEYAKRLQAEYRK